MGERRRNSFHHTVRLSFAAVVLGVLLAIGTSARPPAQDSNSARPGTITYVQGEAWIGSQALAPGIAGKLSLLQGQSLTTGNGKVEIILAPDVSLRIGQQSSLTMISPDLPAARVEIDKGRGVLEIKDRFIIGPFNIHKEPGIRVDQRGLSTRILKNGLYLFDADNPAVRVFKGSAEVRVKGEKFKLVQEQELVLTNGGKLKPDDFDIRQYEGDLIVFSGQPTR